MSNLINALTKLLKLVALFKDDKSAVWISDPLYRFLFEVLVSISILQISNKVLTTTQIESVNKMLTELQTVPSQSINCMVVQEQAAALASMLVNHTAHIAGAALITAVGVVRSVIFMKLDEDLIRGIGKGLYAAYEMYKHMKADQQFALIARLTPTRSLSEAFVSYSQLKDASKCMVATEGNWLLASCYVDNLLKVALTALKYLKSTDDDECGRVFSACILGDENVVGICSITKRIQRGKRKKLGAIGEALLDGESVAGVVRNLIMEAIGELLESVENIATTQLHAFEEKIKIIVGQFSGDAIEMAIEVKDNLLTTVTQLITIMDNIDKNLQIMSKCIDKTVCHSSGLIGYDHRILQHIEG